MGATFMYKSTKKAADETKDVLSPDINIPEPPPPPAQKAGVDDSEGAMERRRKRAMGATGRSDTILTSPLGIPSEPATSRKTLLGY